VEVRSLGYRADHIVRTPHNPTYWWRNFLLLSAVPDASASSVHEPPRPNRDATYRRLTSDEDWALSVDLRLTCRDDEDEDEDAYRTFATRKVATHTLVMVADPDYLAVRVYRSVGFVDGETQLQAERPPVRK
jgi:hypothetical protein